MLHLPAGSVLPKTDVKLLSETNAFVAAAEETDAPLKPILFLVLWFWDLVRYGVFWDVGHGVNISI